MIDRVTPDLVQTLKGTAESRSSTCPPIEAQRWIFQLAKDPVKDQRLRQAISLAIDRNVIIKDLLLGYGRPADSPVPPGLIGHTSMPAKPYDPEKARQILKQAGYKNVSLDFVLMKDLYPKQLEVTQAVAAMLGEVGIKLNIKNLEIATAREQRTAGTYDLFFSGWAHMPHDPDWYFGQWFTKAGSEKLTRYNEPPRGAAHRRGAGARCQGPAGQVRGARAHPVGRGRGTLALLHGRDLRRQRPAEQLRGAPRLLRPAE